METHHTPINVVQRLQLLGLRVLIDNLPPYMPQILKCNRCIGDNTTARDLLNIMTYKKYQRGMKHCRLVDNKHHIDCIMDLFTFMLADYSPELIFPISLYIPTFEQLDTHLLHHGNRLTRLSLTNCHGDNVTTDDILRIICRSLKFLKSLTLAPNGTCSQTGADLIKNSELPNTLYELNLMGTMFSTGDVLLQILSSLTHLKKLNLCQVRMNMCRSLHHHQSLAVQLHLLDNSLLFLENLRVFFFEGCCHKSNEELKWGTFVQNHPNLKTLQLTEESYDSLLCLREGLRTRKEPLAYLAVEIDSSYLSLVNDEYNNALEKKKIIIRQMNANIITTGETIKEILYDMENGGLDSLSVHHMVTLTSFIWRNRSNKKNSEICRDMLRIINLLIPKYTHYSIVFFMCSDIIRFMVQDSRLREELQLTPSFMNTFINHLMMIDDPAIDLEIVREDLVNIIEILAVYKDSISVVVFERVWKTLVLQNRFCYILWDRKKIFRCILDIANYATYEYILAFRKSWGSHTFHNLKLKLMSWFNEPSYLIEKFIKDLETRETFFLKQKLTK